jgi:hypothetical protein
MTHPAVLFASALVVSLPILLIAVVGVVLSRSRIPQSHAKARRLATSGFGLLGLHAIVGMAMRAYADTVTLRSNSPSAAANVLSIANIVSYLLLVTSLVLLLRAVLANRDPMTSSRGAI